MSEELKQAIERAKSYKMDADSSYTWQESSDAYEHALSIAVKELGEKNVHCSTCGKVVSGTMDGTFVVRAYVECPECIEKQPDKDTRILALETSMREIRERFANKLHNESGGDECIGCQLTDFIQQSLDKK